MPGNPSRQVPVVLAIARAGDERNGLFLFFTIIYTILLGAPVAERVKRWSAKQAVWVRFLDGSGNLFNKDYLVYSFNYLFKI